MSYSAEVLADSPLAYWKLDETSGTSAADSSGNSRTATYGGGGVGGTSLLTSGAGHSLALTESGTTTYATIASASWMNQTSITIEALVKITSSVDGANGDAIVSRYAGSGFSWLLWRNTAGKLAVQAV